MNGTGKKLCSFVLLISGHPVPHQIEMKFFAYIHYFIFLAWNWNLRIAIFIIRHEIKGEKKYKLNTSGFDELQHLQKKGIDITHSTIYMPVNYYMVEKMMEKLKPF